MWELYIFIGIFGDERLDRDLEARARHAIKDLVCDQIHLYTAMIFLIMTYYENKAVFNWSKRSLGGNTEGTKK